MQLTLLNLDLKNAQLRNVLRRASKPLLCQWQEGLRQSWVYHDHALEGIVLTEAEFARGLAGEAGKDCCEQALLDSVGRLYRGLAEVERAATAREPISLDTLKRMHVLCAPADDNAGRYRKVEGPLGCYMQDCAAPKAISYRLRRLAELIEQETSKLHPVQAAVMVHHEFMSVFPFDKLTGRAGRLLLSYWLLREGYPLLVLPAASRADYYNALCQPDAYDLLNLVSHSLETSMTQALRKLAGESARRAA